MASMDFHQGDTVRIVDVDQHHGRVGVIYDAIGIPHDPWTRSGDDGQPEFRVYFDLVLDAGWFAADQLDLVAPMPPPGFEPRQRVRVRQSAHWAQGEAGTLWDESSFAIRRRRTGPTRIYMVSLDHPHDDGSGDGPYSGGEFSDDDLEPLD
jgi:hypothetical protein